MTKHSTLIGTTRRGFIRSASAAGAYLLLGGVPFYGQQSSAVSINDYKRASEVKGVPELIIRTETKLEVSKDKMDEYLKEARRSFIDKKNRDVKPPLRILEPGELKESGAYNSDCLILEPDPGYAGHIVKLSSMAIDHALELFAHPKLPKPKYSFYLPRTKKQTESLPSSRDDVSICLVFSHDYTNTVRIRFENDSADDVFEKIIEKKFLRGENTSYFLGLFEPSYTRVPVVYRPIMISTGQDPEYLVATPVIEMFHHQTMGIASRYIERDANRPNPAAPLSPAELFFMAKNKHQNRNELISHAMGRIWLEVYNLDAGLGIAEGKIDQMDFGPPSKDDVRNFCSLIRKLGFPQMMNIYENDPDRLFIDFPAYR